MRLSALLDRQLLLLGAAREGQATLAWLRGRGYRGAAFATGDRPPEPALEDVRFVPAHALAGILGPDTVAVRSPGFAPHHPLRRVLDASATLQTTATRIALAELSRAGLPVIGVTASKGKSTISTLTHRLLLAAGVRAELVGNIGVPVLSRLDTILETRSVVVMELSSYQCDDLQPGEGPTQAVFGRLFPEHLDWHGDLGAYYGAKARLLACAPAGAWLHVDHRAAAELAAHAHDAALARRDVTREWVNHERGLHVADGHFRDGHQVLLDAAGMRLPGLHNRENACLAFAAARRHGAQVSHLAAVLAEFGGLPFRLEDEGLHGGVRWINDSISTAPEAACAGLEALHGTASTLVAGGQDRGYDYRPLARAMLDWQVATLVALPESGPQIIAALALALQERDAPAGNRADAAPRVLAAASLAEAVALAAAATAPGSTCLFSPAAPSYHAWPGFEARGREFRALVAALDQR